MDGHRSYPALAGLPVLHPVAQHERRRRLVDAPPHRSPAAPRRIQVRSRVVRRPGLIPGLGGDPQCDKTVDDPAAARAVFALRAVVAHGQAHYHLVGTVLPAQLGEPFCGFPLGDEGDGRERRGEGAARVRQGEADAPFAEVDAEDPPQR